MDDEQMYAIFKDETFKKAKEVYSQHMSFKRGDINLLAPNIYSATELYVDSREAVWNSSTCLIQAKNQELLNPNDMGTEIGEILISDKKNSEIIRAKRTLFKSVGLAVQDLVFAREIINQINN
jgi:ornithine cyclodeaminase